MRDRSRPRLRHPVIGSRNATGWAIFEWSVQARYSFADLPSLDLERPAAVASSCLPLENISGRRQRVRRREKRLCLRARALTDHRCWCKTVQFYSSDQAANVLSFYWLLFCSSTLTSASTFSYSDLATCCYCRLLATPYSFFFLFERSYSVFLFSCLRLPGWTALPCWQKFDAASRRKYPRGRGVCDGCQNICHNLLFLLTHITCH
jgi:hypothetical protein